MTHFTLHQFRKSLFLQQMSNQCLLFNQMKSSPTDLRLVYQTRFCTQMSLNSTSELPETFCLISILRTKNNTHCVISNLFGQQKTIWSTSSGQLSVASRSGGRRKTRLSQRLVYKSTAEKALGLGFENAVVHCRGSRGSKAQIFRSFSSSLKVILLKDLTGIAHNGCRPPKARRI